VGDKDLADIEKRLALLEYRFNEHNREADKWKTRIVDMEHLIHHGKSLLIAVRLFFIGGAFIAIAASQGWWAAITRVLKP
jgi:hypothetical protein